MRKIYFLILIVSLIISCTDNKKQSTIHNTNSVVSYDYLSVPQEGYRIVSGSNGFTMLLNTDSLNNYNVLLGVFPNNQYKRIKEKLVLITIDSENYTVRSIFSFNASAFCQKIKDKSGYAISYYDYNNAKDSINEVDIPNDEDFEIQQSKDDVIVRIFKTINEASIIADRISTNGIDGWPQVAEILRNIQGINHQYLTSSTNINPYLKQNLTKFSDTEKKMLYFESQLLEEENN